jgi:hypothetical protein
MIRLAGPSTPRPGPGMLEEIATRLGSVIRNQEGANHGEGDGSCHEASPIQRGDCPAYPLRLVFRR